jgi:hypothetical protein
MASPDTQTRRGSPPAWGYSHHFAPHTDLIDISSSAKGTHRDLHG